MSLLDEQGSLERKDSYEENIGWNSAWFRFGPADNVKSL